MASGAAAAMSANQHRRAQSRPLAHEYSLDSNQASRQHSRGAKQGAQNSGQTSWQMPSAGSSSPNSKVKNSMHSRDGSSHRSREGHNFRVGNIGNNGVLYLRPVPRSNGAYHPQSPPMTPPLSLDSPPDLAQSDDPDWRDSLLSDSNTWWSSVLGFSSLDRPGQSSQNTPTKYEGQGSLVFGDSPPSDDDRPNEVKIVINRTSSPPPPPGNAAKPKSNTVPDARNMLGVTIPHYRLGTPRFTGAGSAILRSSLNTGTATSEMGFSDDIRSSILSTHSFSIRGFPEPPGRARRYSATEITTPQETKAESTFPSSQKYRASQMNPPKNPSQTRILSTTSVWEDDDPFMVQLSPVTGQVVVATPSGLIAQITSPNLLDYELLSDFFLTYRSFLTPSELTVCLLNRLRWAVHRNDDFGRIVRVRTFVAIRHWILNYFVEDFVPSLPMRRQFCDLVNDLCKELRSRSDAGGGDIKILGELKRCWRRTCALYWDIPNQHSTNADDELVPGGQLGTRSSPMVSSEVLAQPGDKLASSTRAAGAAIAALSRNPAPERVTSTSHRVPRATRMPRTTSDQSAIDVISCTIPRPSMYKTAPPSSADQAKIASGQQRPQHRRSNSFSDSLRDNRAPLSMSKTADKGMAHSSVNQAFPCSGVLIRGALFHPSSPYVDFIAPGSPANGESVFTFNVQDETDPLSADERSNNYGVQSIIGTVRRALSTKRRPPPLKLDDREPPRKKSTASSESKHSGSNARARPGTPKRILLGGQAHLRIDLLAAGVAETFQTALEKDNVHVENVSTHPIPSSPSTNLSFLKPETYSRPPKAPRLNSDVTMGSRSIVIVDDTGGNTPAFDLDSFPTHLQHDHNLQREHRNDRTEFEGKNSEEIGRAQPLGFEVSQRATMGESTDWNLSELSGADVDGSVDTEHSMLQPDGTNELLEGGQVAQKNFDGRSAISEVSKTSTNDPFYLERLPMRQLRRRPGGDLRAADHVHSLEYQQRSSQHSVIKSPKSQISRQTSPPPRKGAGSPKTFSMMDTHSSQPAMRPSFEREVAKLAQIDDEDSDDGGIESTLLKLEGKHAKTPVTPTFPGGLFDSEGRMASPTASEASWAKLARNEKGLGRLHEHSPRPNQSSPQLTQSPKEKAGNAAVRGISIKPTVDVGPAPTEELPAPPLSGTSLPSLVTTEREIDSPESDREDNSNWGWLKVSLPPSSREGPSEDKPSTYFQDSMSPITHQNRHSLIRIDALSGSPQGVSNSQTHKVKQSVSEESHQSFLLNEDESIASTTPTRVLHDRYAITSWYVGNSAAGSYPENINNSNVAEGIGLAITTSATDETFLQSPVVESVVDPLNSPQSTPSKPILSQGQANLHPVKETPQPVRKYNNLLLTPDDGIKRDASLAAFSEAEPRPSMSNTPIGAHLPWILGYDSRLIAQQLTLVEKDALSEIDWRELIDIQWKQSTSPYYNWVDYLRSDTWSHSTQNSGVDICIARFNLMVKWAVSEIVLTQDTNERTATISKYIHIAQHCRTLRNWASMYQITMALINSDVSRLQRSWAAVPETDKTILKRLEQLVMPTRNFHNLRTEMESAAAEGALQGEKYGKGGCIPFIGVYTHDLIYNAQKPAYIERPGGGGGSGGTGAAEKRGDSTSRENNEGEAGASNGVNGGTAEKWVNFERQHTAAAIVKHLLRMLDESNKYTFQPVPDVLSRCVWVSALTDDDIQSRSRSLES